MEALVPILIVLGVVLFIGAIIYFSWLHEKKRREALEAVATEMGLEYKKDGDVSLQDQLDGFKLFSNGRSRKLDNLIVGETDEVRIALFDYRYTVGSGKHRSTPRQTVASLQSASLVIPDFSMRPEGMFDRIGGMIGFQDVNFDTHPTFSKMFVLKGNNEEAVRQCFTPAVLEFFEQRKGISVEADHGRLIFFRPNKRLKADEFRDLLGQAYEVFGAMTGDNKA